MRESKGTKLAKGQFAQTSKAMLRQTDLSSKRRGATDVSSWGKPQSTSLLEIRPLIFVTSFVSELHKANL